MLAGPRRRAGRQCRGRAGHRAAGGRASTGTVSLVSLPANLLAAPAVAPATVLGLAAAVVAPAWPAAADALVWLAGWPADWLVGVAATAAALPGRGDRMAGGSRRRRAARPASCCSGHGCCGASRGCARSPSRRWSVWSSWAGPCGRRSGAGRRRTPSRSSATWGRATRSSCRPGEGPGSWSTPVPISAAVDRCLDRLGITSLPLVLVSHLDADHVGGLAGALAGRDVGVVATGTLSPADDRVAGFAALVDRRRWRAADAGARGPAHGRRGVGRGARPGSRARHGGSGRQRPVDGRPRRGARPVDPAHRRPRRRGRGPAPPQRRRPARRRPQGAAPRQQRRRPGVPRGHRRPARARVGRRRQHLRASRAAAAAVARTGGHAGPPHRPRRRPRARRRSTPRGAWRRSRARRPRRRATSTERGHLGTAEASQPRDTMRECLPIPSNPPRACVW